MIICVCQSVSDREVRAAIRNGVTSLEQLQLELGVASGCGKCTNAVCEMLIQTRRCTGKEEAHARPRKAA
ncbi:BFD domain protein (2Fe-2S)-binding domain protein; bacterioferritin-associated ferredoxin [Candidatus Glomeribacter gigasporarum BEG34]|uniref:Bacterioferritin-associated ferredoxin n=1 Tax=Candidatus Glomeribacter gigasporarum BEG34 TaxID=1070319 RepID=G2J9U0_9BURK|nr:(2Fe-2S)-binding protein [Candidatus Glomeribacter gigasporarum]CCD29537.1 BFD domain protein (2Fe-2S)-binding domain protein; bacterioferritin-associated ferredoxin [Candidatus Glomeribacter gigasporarum BEG34]